MISENQSPKKSIFKNPFVYSSLLILVVAAYVGWVIFSRHQDTRAYDERAALQVMDDGKTTTQRAVEALQRPERFAGEHDVARAWLRTQEPHMRPFWRNKE